MAPPRDNFNNEINSNDNVVDTPSQPIASPYANNRDPMSNVGNFKIIESTLRGTC